MYYSPLDGANVEIQEEAGAENEYIFGAKVEEIEKLKTEGSYSARRIYDTNPEIRKVIDTLIDGTFSDGGKHGEGSFAELHNSLINGASWHAPDHYFILLDLPSYVETKIKANADFENREEYTPPEILRSSLAGVILTMLDLGLGSMDDFPFIDPPKPAMVAQGYRELLELGAIRREERHAPPAMTKLGRQLCRFPVEPRLARMLIEASRLAALPSTLPIVTTTSSFLKRA